jgi:uncharacterized protein (TIGR02118 family)
MVKMIAIYRRPEDVEAFMKHYEEVHLPLARKMPGLLKMELNYMYNAKGGEADPFLMAELYFDSRESLMAAMKSPEGRAGGKDIQEFAGDLVQIYFADVTSEEM